MAISIKSETLGKIFTILKQGSLSLLAASGAFLGLFTVYDAISADLVIMEPLRVPASFENKGYTGEIATQRLLDEIARLNAFSPSAKDRKYYGDQALFDTISKSEVSIAGIDIKAIRAAIQKATGREPKKISGEIALATVGGKEAFTVRLRSNPPRRLLVDIAVDGEPIAVLQKTALTLLEQLDPTIAASVYRLRNDYTNALRLVDAALTNDDSSDDRSALAEKSFIRSQQRRFDEAKADALAASANGQPYFGTHMALATLYREMGQFEESLAEADKASKLAPRSPQGDFLKARTLLRMRKTDEAIALLRKASAAYPDFWPGHQFLGVAYTQKGDLDAAKLAYGRTLALAPQMGFVHFALGEIENNQGNKRAALRSFREAYAQVPANPQFLIALLEAEKESGQAAQVAELQAALRTAIAENQVPDGLRRRADAALAEAISKQ